MVSSVCVCVSKAIRYEVDDNYRKMGKEGKLIYIMMMMMIISDFPRENTHLCRRTHTPTTDRRDWIHFALRTLAMLQCDVGQP